MSILNQPNGFLVGFDLSDYPAGAHEAIIADIKEKYKKNDDARRILDTTWIIKAESRSSQDLYNVIRSIIKKHIGKGIFYITVWKINFSNYWQNMRPNDQKWFSSKFGIE
ncbi:MAG: hypothetical protein EHM58_02435 [Ignavibacteriae bacterium]|nr:MAG: hypothetical protein EHM58_02435 [Ignavibacteriota bacterium]